ncbi:MAG: Metacaspase [uncultured Sulfurovum sp.]|uniref:Metacaspase n=1 Tax=uncultured Sulfurovum sp. TaxID=269237 RepID=A0A6S6RUJ6_9BACT|nr:MAG: Metacaspase [uncultured Sulfurovum sp.]
MTLFNKLLLKSTLSLFFLIFFQACVSEKVNGQSKGLALAQSNAMSNVLFSKNIQNNKKALVVGVSDYAGENADLNGIERDVEKMKNMFESWGFEVTTLYDAEALKIVDYLSNYGRDLSNNDYFAFYYSGHGSHKKDENNDESDGSDETLVLSNGKENIHLLDDVLYAKFNTIKAKKMIFFDSCHSGTVFRSLNGKVQSKTIDAATVNRTLSKGLNISTSKDIIENNSDFIVFSSARDDEEALATPNGSLFTNSLYRLFSNQNSLNQPFSDIKKSLTSDVLRYARENSAKEHHPNISYSKSYSSSSTLKDFTQSQSKIASANTPISSNTSNTAKEITLQETLEGFIQEGKMEKMSLNYDNTTYTVGQSVEFSLNTQGARGYLTIFYVDKNDVTLLYPNSFVQPKIIEGSYHFPKDFSGGKFELEAYKSCHNCQEEQTTIYTLLSSEPILQSSVFKSKDGLLSFAKGSQKSQVVTRAVRLKAISKNTNSSPKLGKYQFIVK